MGEECDVESVCEVYMGEECDVECAWVKSVMWSVYEVCMGEV